MGRFLVVPIFILHVTICCAQQVTNTSYLNGAGEKILRFEMTVPVPLTEAWRYFTVDELLKKWIAPQAHIELKTGGYILTNYAADKKLEDPSSIKLGIINYLEGEMITFKVDLNDNFSAVLQQEDGNLQEVIQFMKVGEGKTKIVSSMIGWGKGERWANTYTFFERGNEWTYQEFIKLFEKK